jgi:hypothetical protein
LIAVGTFVAQEPLVFFAMAEVHPQHAVPAGPGVG